MAEYNTYCKKQQIYQNYETKACALLKTRSTKEIKNKVEERSDFRLKKMQTLKQCYG
jgi:hypothetical protein